MSARDRDLRDEFCELIVDRLWYICYKLKLTNGQIPCDYLDCECECPLMTEKLLKALGAEDE